MFSRFEQWRGRAIRVALVALVHVLAALIGFYLSPPITPRKPQPDLLVTMLPSLEQKQDEPKPKAAAARPRTVSPPKAQSEPVPEPIVELPMMMVSSDVFRASDISRFKREARDPAPATELADADSDMSIGRGPGGERLYAAQWYREPTDAELDTYMPRKGLRSGHGLIICRTVADYRVEDCREIEEAPPMSGLARAMRLASWQFRVRPPRIGGKPMIGSWVQIRFDLIEGFKK